MIYLFSIFTLQLILQVIKIMKLRPHKITLATLTEGAHC